MGGVNSNLIPLWMNPGQSPPGYDMFGATGNMAKPPQYDWSELYVEGTPDTSLFSSEYIAGKNKIMTTPKAYLVGQENDRMNTWGSNVFAPVQNEVGNEAITQQFPMSPEQFATRSSWKPNLTRTSPLPTCTPTSFPNCDMSDFAVANTPLIQYANWWRGTEDDIFAKDAAIPLLVTKEIDASQVYADAIERSLQSFVTGKYDGIELLNSSDTSSYDPCAGQSTIEKILPVVLGGAALVVIRIYGAEIFAFLPATSKGYLEATAFLTMYFLGEALVLEGSVIEDGFAPIGVQVGNASTTLAVGSGLTLSGVVASQTAFENISPIYVTIGMGAIGYLLKDVAYKPLLGIIVSGSPIFLLPALITHWISKLFCRISSAGLNACDDFGENAGGTDQGFEDVRRWDVPSLCARLTDLAIADLDISRDHPRAQFIYRSLMTNPSWMSAATIGKNEESNLWNSQKVNLNPLGLINPIEESGNNTLFTIQPEGLGWAQKWSDTRYSFTGDAAVTGIDVTSQQNLFACQNFDILYNAANCWNGTGNNPNGLPQCADSTVDTGEDIALANNMRLWLKAAVDASENPDNLIKQFAIPGIHPKQYYTPNEIPPVADFLRDAFKDATDVPGIGFNDISDRGAFAAYYTNVSHPLAEGKELTACLANGLFTQPNMITAWQYVLQKWDIQDQIALAHYWYKDDEIEFGAAQYESFKQWEDGYEGVKEFKKKHLLNNKGFTEDPVQTPLTPLDGTLEPLQPANPFQPTSPSPRWITMILDALGEFPSLASQYVTPDVVLDASRNNSNYPPYTPFEWFLLAVAFNAVGDVVNGEIASGYAARVMDILAEYTVEMSQIGFLKTFLTTTAEGKPFYDALDAADKSDVEQW